MKTPPPEMAERLFAVGDQFLAPGVDPRVDDVAAALDMPRATLYYYFAGKDDIVAFLLQQKVERGTTAIAEAAARAGTPTERLDGVLRAALGAMAEHPALCTRLTGYLAAAGTFGQVVLAAERQVFAPVRAIIVEGQATQEFSVTDPAETASALMGALMFVGTGQILATGELDAQSVADRLVPQLLNGVVAR